MVHHRVESARACEVLAGGQHRAAEAGAGQVGSGQLDPGEKGPGKVRVVEIGFGQSRPVEYRHRQGRVGQVALPPDGMAQCRGRQVGTREVAPDDRRVAEVGPHERGAFQHGVLERGELEGGPEGVGADEAGTDERGGEELGIGEAGVGQVGVGTVGRGQVGAVESGLSEIRPSQPGLAEVGAPEIRSPEVRPGQVGTGQCQPGQRGPDQRVGRRSPQDGVRVSSADLEHDDLLGWGPACGGAQVYVPGREGPDPPVVRLRDRCRLASSTVTRRGHW